MTNPKSYQFAHAERCCEPMDVSNLRNNYFDGKTLSVDSFQVEQRYALNRRRLLNRAIHGWGVVYGYEVSIAAADNQGKNRLMIGDGFALDACGRELLHASRLLSVPDILFLDGDDKLVKAADVPALLSKYEDNACWLLSVHYAERNAGPVTLENACQCDRREWDHTFELVRFSLRPTQPEKCCLGDPCEIQCQCPPPEDGQRCADSQMHQPNRRGGCQCLCDYFTRLAPVAPAPLCEIDDLCGTTRVDLYNSVPLACVGLLKDESNRLVFAPAVESCGPRRFVKRNDLLFDLVRGCDLTRISEIGWHDWHRRDQAIPFEEFLRGLGDSGKPQEECVANKFWVRFSRPVIKDTLRADCFAITLLCSEREGGWWQTYRFPIVRVDTTDFAAGPDDHEHVTGAKLVFDGDWLEDAVRGRKNLFLGTETRVEIEMRGDFILDCNHLAVDANASGLSATPAGNGTPGGTFLSTFRVGPATPYAPIQQH